MIIINSSYVLIITTPFVRPPKRVGAHPPSCLVKHIIFSMCGCYLQSWLNYCNSTSDWGRVALFRGFPNESFRQVICVPDLGTQGHLSLSDRIMIRSHMSRQFRRVSISSDLHCQFGIPMGSVLSTPSSSKIKAYTPDSLTTVIPLRGSKYRFGIWGIIISVTPGSKRSIKWWWGEYYSHHRQFGVTVVF